MTSVLLCEIVIRRDTQWETESFSEKYVFLPSDGKIIYNTNLGVFYENRYQTAGKWQIRPSICKGNEFSAPLSPCQWSTLSLSPKEGSLYIILRDKQGMISLGSRCHEAMTHLPRCRSCPMGHVQGVSPHLPVTLVSVHLRLHQYSHYTIDHGCHNPISTTITNKAREVIKTAPGSSSLVGNILDWGCGS